VFSPYSGELLLLEDEVRARLGKAKAGSIFITGPPGSGKTTALEHLALVLADAGNVRFLDEPDFGEVLRRQDKEWVVCTAPEKDTKGLRLAPWGVDDLIEYLLAAQKERCRTVMSRLGDSPDPFDGNPELWRMALDQMAADETLATPRQVLDRFLDTLAASPAMPKYQIWALGSLVAKSPPAETEDELRAAEGDSRFRVLRHRPAQLALAARRILQDIQTGQTCEYFRWQFPHDLVGEAALVARDQPASLELMQTWFSDRPERHAMAASILHAAQIGWIPAAKTHLKLVGAYLQSLSAPRLKLREADLSGADLSQANFERADLSQCRAVTTNLRHARLMCATLGKLAARGADLEHADLSRAKAWQASFEDASLKNADLHEANLEEASFVDANLTGADFSGANLEQADLTRANVNEACFRTANLEKATLVGVKLCEGDFAGACFHGARLDGCDLEGMELPGADFRKASLQDALLTGSSMPEACFDGACFHGAGLAEIDWEGASLRGADLRGVSFHLGSSRSGRVGSPIASEGSRRFLHRRLQRPGFQGPGGNPQSQPLSRRPARRPNR
jgi:uncharacterized protein YjbI with pentapeptide repeats